MINGPRPWPPGKKKDDIVDAEFENVWPPEEVLKLTYQGSSEGVESVESSKSNEPSKVPGTMIREELADGASVRRLVPETDPNSESPAEVSMDEVLDNIAKKPRGKHERRGTGKGNGQQSLGKGMEALQHHPLAQAVTKEPLVADTQEASETPSGNPPNPSLEEGIPVMITRDMHQQLADLGYSEDLRKQLTPDEAHRVIASGITLEQVRGTASTVPTNEVPATDLTPREKREALSKALGSNKETFESVQNEYFAALKEQSKKQSGLKTMAGQFIDIDPTEAKELKELRTNWFKARAAFAGEQRKSAEARLKVNPNDARAALLEKLKAKHGEGSEKADIFARYERMVMVRSIVKGAEEAELAAKMEGLSERDKGALDKMFEKYKKLPPGIRILSTSALMFGGAALAAGSPVGLAALGLGGASALARWGAEATKSPALSSVARLLSVGGITGYLAEAAVRGSHHILGTEREAADTLAKREGFGDLTNADNIARISKERKSALGAKERVEREGRLARVFGALAGGWAFGQATSSGGETVEATSSSDGISSGQAETDSVTSTSSAASSVESVPAATQPEASIQPETPYITPTAPEGAMLHEATIGRGEGFNQLFVDLRNAGFTGFDSELSATELSEKFGAFDPETGRSMVMLEGDKLVVDANQNVWFVREGQEPQLMLENKGGTLIPRELDFEGKDMRAYGPSNIAEANTPPEVSGVTEEQGPRVAPVVSTEVDTEDVSRIVAEQDSVAPSQAEGPSTLGDYAYEGERAPTESAGPSATTEQSGEAITPERRMLGDYQLDRESPAIGILNTHGVEVNSAVPGGYAWQIPGMDTPGTFVFGGDADATRMWALRELELNPEARVYVNYLETDTGGVPEMRVGQWRLNENGIPEFEQSIKDPMTGQPLRPATPDDFTKKLT